MGRQVTAMTLGACALALAGVALAWAGWEIIQAGKVLNAFEDRLGRLDARLSRLQRIVERGWTQSLDLTSFDWSRQSEPPPDTDPEG
jgi:hypothetical protein